MSNLQIETARSRLRLFTPDDVDALHAHWTDPQVRKYLWDDVIIPRAQVVEVMEKCGMTFAKRIWINNLEAVYYVIRKEAFQPGDEFYRLSK